MPVSENSKKAYREIKNLGDNQRIVYYQVQAMERSGRIPSSQDIADELGWPINWVTGRVSELKDIGYLQVHGKGRSRYGRPVDIYCTANPAVDSKLLHHFNLEENDDVAEPHYFGVANG